MVFLHDYEIILALAVVSILAMLLRKCLSNRYCAWENLLPISEQLCMERHHGDLFQHTGCLYRCFPSFPQVNGHATLPNGMHLPGSTPLRLKAQR